MYNNTKNWLVSLNSDGTGAGAIYLANLYLSWRENILLPDVIRSFLAECYSKKVADPRKDALSIYRDVARQYCRSGLQSAIRPTTKATINASTTMTSDNFHQYISDKIKVTNAMLPAPPLRKKPKATADGETKFKEALARITSIQDWYKTDGLCLGAPYPNQTYCWLASSYSMSQILRQSPAGKSKGDVARDVLGLVDDVAGTHHRIRFQFKLKVDPSKDSVARPHSLGGNLRFATRLPGTPMLTHYYSAKWGSTTNLDKLAAKSSNIAGLPERISTPIPLAKIGPTLSIDYLGPVTTHRDTNHSNNLEYAQYLLEGVSAIDAINELATLFKP